MADAKGYVASAETVYRYPRAGDQAPPGGAKVLLLTIGGICVTGSWADDGRYLAWAPMPMRDKTRESLLAASPQPRQGAALAADEKTQERAGAG